jgi:acetyl-CoA carboxylase biotin carboxyl carrier protein
VGWEVMIMEYKDIKDLIKTASEEELTYLNIETEGIHIIMKKGSQENGNDLAIEKDVNTAGKTNETMEIAKKEDMVIKNKPVIEDKNIKVVKSPIVGTFYASGDPKAEAFAKVGSKVKKGDVICLIEAMKLMNEIDVEFDGEVVEVLVQNEQMVEYGQGLFKIKCN